MRKALDRLQHPKPRRLQYEPHCWSVPTYGKSLQMTPYPDESDIIDKKSNKIINSIVGTMLYYALSVDPTMLRAIQENFASTITTNKGHGGKINNVTRLCSNVPECNHPL